MARFIVVPKVHNGRHTSYEIIDTDAAKPHRARLGYVDDVHGYDFVNNDGDPMDDNLHGTHCAGIVAGNAATGETDPDSGAWYGLGIAPGANLFIERIFDDFAGEASPFPSDENLTRDAVRHGAKIGSNAVVTKAIPAGATAVGIPGRIIVKADPEQEAKRQAIAERFGFDAYGLGQDMPDPVARAIGQLLDHVQAVDERLDGMCKALTALGSDYSAKALPELRDEDFAGVKDDEPKPAA